MVMMQEPPRAVLPRTACCDIDRPDGDRQRLFVAWPATPAPAHGHPVVYVLDGNAHFHVAVQVARALTYRSEFTGLDPAIVVGIGYPIDEDYDLRRRTFDYTPRVRQERLLPRPNGEAWPAVGGADQFIDLVETIIKPFIEARWPVDKERQALFGHSFGGLFVLYHTFIRPALYRSFLASSPSIWFASRSILEHEAEFARRLIALGQSRDLMISVGDQEQSVPAERRAAAGERWLAWLAQNRMVDNACELGGRLDRLTSSGLSLSLFVFDDENHVTAPPLALSKGLRIALRPREPVAAIVRQASA